MVDDNNKTEVVKKENECKQCDGNTMLPVKSYDKLQVAISWEEIGKEIRKGRKFDEELIKEKSVWLSGGRFCRLLTHKFLSKQITQYLKEGSTYKEAVLRALMTLQANYPKAYRAFLIKSVGLNEKQIKELEKEMIR